MKETKVKENKKKLKMSLKDIYKVVNHAEMSKIIEIKDTFSLRSNFKKFLDEHLVSFVFYSLVILVLTIIVFSKDIWALLCVLGVMVLAVIYAIYNNTYSVKFTEKNVIIEYRFHKQIIPYDDLFNIYLEKQHVSLFIYTYRIVFIYAEDFKGLNGEKNKRMSFYSLPTFSVAKSDLMNFFNLFEYSHEFDENYNEEEEKLAKKELKHKYSEKGQSDKAFIIGFFVVLAIVIIGVSALVIALATRT